MKIIGLLSWYNESPAMLASAVSSAAPFLDHLVAVDGAYAFFPDAQPCSPADQSTTIRDTARVAGLGVTIHEPTVSWAGNEVEKRSFMFHMGETLTTPDDWYYVIDADETITSVHCDIRATLEQTTFGTGEVTYWWHRPHTTPEDRPFASPLKERQGITKFFRAIPGLHVSGAHYRYITPDGRTLWNPATTDAVEPADLRGVYVQHRNTERDLWRSQEAATYYERRDANKIEALEATA